MKRFYVPAVAISGFLLVWLSLSPEAEMEAELTTDRIPLSQAQAERTKEASEASAPEAKKSDQAEASSEFSEDSCIPAQAISDLRSRKKTLDDREAAIAAREQEIAVREKAVEERIKLLQTSREEAGKMDAAKKKEFDDKIARTVELLESMNPKAAAQVVASSDERIAVEAMARMSTAKLSKILNIMEPKRSTRLMELLAGKGTPAADLSKAVSENNPRKEEKL